MQKTQIQSATIALSGSLTGSIPIAGATQIGLWVPVVTSCQLFVLGSYDQSSANFTRLTNIAGSGDWTLSVGPGSRSVSLVNGGASAFPFIKMETSVAQAAVRNFFISAKY